MKVQAHFVADSALFAVDGTFTVYRGGITEMRSATWPVMSKLAIITRLALEPDEVSGLIEVRLRFLHENQLLGEAGQPIAARVPDPARPVYVNSIVELNMGIPGPGTITIEATVDDKRLPLLYLWAIQT